MLKSLPYYLLTRHVWLDAIFSTETDFSEL